MLDAATMSPRFDATPRLYAMRYTLCYVLFFIVTRLRPRSLHAVCYDVTSLSRQYHHSHIYFQVTLFSA